MDVKICAGPALVICHRAIIIGGRLNGKKSKNGN